MKNLKFKQEFIDKLTHYSLIEVLKFIVKVGKMGDSSVFFNKYQSEIIEKINTEVSGNEQIQRRLQEYGILDVWFEEDI